MLTNFVMKTKFATNSYQFFYKIFYIKHFLQKKKKC